MPSMASGSTGTPASTASRKAPSWKAFTRPSRERVPSAKNITEHRFASTPRARARTRARLSGSLRSTGMSPASFISQPKNGRSKSSFLATHFISHGSRETSGMSALDWWLLTTTYGRRGSVGMPPVTVTVHAGLTRDVWLPIQRNVRPVA